MKTIIFVCHGNICRSIAAEEIAKEYLKSINRGDEFKIISRAISTEEIGNDIYYRMKEALRKNGIPFEKHRAALISKKDYDEADFIFYMDRENKYYLDRFFPNSRKIFAITMYNSNLEEIEDPWYTSRFDLVIKELQDCVKQIFKRL